MKTLSIALALPAIVDGLDYPIGITNCGVQSWIKSPPQRAVTMNQGTTEVMLALGLADRMVGTAYIDDYIWPELEAEYNTVPVIAKEYPTIDELLSVKPDFVYASYSSAFATSSVNYTQGLPTEILGEVVQDTTVTVMIPATAFDLTVHGRVYVENILPEHLAPLQDREMLPFLDKAVADTEHLRTRYLMYLPARFAHLFLTNRGLTPKDAYLTFHQAALQENANMDEVQPILDWLRLTLHATQQNNGGPPVTSLNITIPLLDEDLSAHRSPLVAHILAPRQQNLTTGLELAINHMATAVTQQTAEVNRAQLARAVEREAPVTPANKFGLLLNSLKHYLHVQEEEELPEFWFQFASASKKQDF